MKKIIPFLFALISCIIAVGQPKDYKSEQQCEHL